MKKEAIEIKKENLKLGSLNLPILEMLDKQEKLENKFVDLGYSRDEFFKASRDIAGIDDSSGVVDFNQIKSFFDKQKGE